MSAEAFADSTEFSPPPRLRASYPDRSFGHLCHLRGLPAASVHGRSPLFLSSAPRAWSIVLIVIGTVALIAYAALLPVILNWRQRSCTERRLPRTALRPAAQAFGNGSNCSTQAQSSDPTYSPATSTPLRRRQRHSSNMSSQSRLISYRTPPRRRRQRRTGRFRHGVRPSTVGQLTRPAVVHYDHPESAFLDTLDAVDSSYEQLDQALGGWTEGEYLDVVRWYGLTHAVWEVGRINS